MRKYWPIIVSNAPPRSDNSLGADDHRDHSWGVTRCNVDCRPERGDRMLWRLITKTFRSVYRSLKSSGRLTWAKEGNVKPNKIKPKMVLKVLNILMICLSAKIQKKTCGTDKSAPHSVKLTQKFILKLMTKICCKGKVISPPVKSPLVGIFLCLYPLFRGFPYHRRPQSL